MKKFNLVLGMFVLSLFLIPSFKVNAEAVTNEKELRDAISKGGDVVINNNITVSDTIVINKNVKIKSASASDTNTINIDADKTLFQIDSGNVTFENITLVAGVVSETSPTYNGGKAIVANGGDVEINTSMVTSGDDAVTVNSGAYVKVNGDKNKTLENAYITVSKKNAFFINGGTLELSGAQYIGGANKGIYINKGESNRTDGNSLILTNTFALVSKNNKMSQLLEQMHGTLNSDIYINPTERVVKVKDEQELFVLCGRQIKYMINTCEATETGGQCTQYETFYTNDLEDCTTIYINGEKTILGSSDNCPPVIDEDDTIQIVDVPATSAFGSIVIIVLGVVCIIGSAVVTKMMTKESR